MSLDFAPLFALVCGQLPEHTWTPGGVPLGVCQRCTGLYAGAAVALLLHAALRLRPSDRFLLMHGAFLLLMVPFGYHWVPQDGLVRTLTGIVFGAGVVDFLWLNVAARVPGPRTPDRARWAGYLAALGTALVAVPVLAINGGAGAATALDALAVAGLVALALLALANLVLALRALGRRCLHVART